MKFPSDEVIKEIAGEVDGGFNCYLHKENFEIIAIPNELRFLDIDEELWQESIDIVENNPGAYFVIEPLESRESFKIMEHFIDTLAENSRLRDRLIHALNRSKPFHNFKYEIDNSGEYRQKWFDFKQAQIEEHVRKLIELELREEELDL
jgi:hypothetical protein